MSIMGLFDTFVQHVDKQAPSIVMPSRDARIAMAMLHMVEEESGVM